MPDHSERGDNTSNAARDIAWHLHPFTNMRRLESEGPLVITGGRGIHVTDDADPAHRVDGDTHFAFLVTERAFEDQAILAALNRNKNSFPDLDWRKTRAFSLPTDRNSHIRINLRGREPMGIVDPGSDYESLLDQLEAALKALINPLTGRPAVEEVFRVRALFPGERAEDLPDVAVLWSAEAPIDEVSSSQLGMIRRPIRELRSGNHREEGFLLARGPSFKEGRGAYPGHILQIAPTLLHLHGLAIPDEYDMQPFDDILR